MSVLQDVRAIARAFPCIVLGCVLAGGCESEQDAVKFASRSLTRKEMQGAPRAATTPIVTRSRTPSYYALFVDGSQSMAGYVGCRVQPTEFDEILDRLSVDLGVTSLNRFGSVAGSKELLRASAIDAAVHCPPFYDRAQNPDAELFRRFLEDSTGQIHLYVTDGVQSDLSATQSPSVNVLREWIGSGRPLAVLAFRSRFTGRGWSEARKKWAGEWRATDRPFYLYIFAPSDAMLDRTIGRLSSDVRARSELIRFGDAATRCNASPASIPRSATDASPPWLLLSASTTARLLKHPLPIVEISCAVLAGSPLARIQFSADSVKYGRWTGAGFAYPAPVPSGVTIKGDSVASERSGFRTYVTMQLVDDATTRFGYFALQLIPTSIQLNAHVSELSTNSDADVSSAGKTYRFAWVIEQLLRAQIEHNLPRLDFFLTTTYR